MSGATWLYLFEDHNRRSLYIGIADSLDRVWQPHNPDAEAVIKAPGSQILQTVEPFSSRGDALKAEAIAIHVAMLSRVAVYHAGDQISVDEGQVLVTNRAGTNSTRVLGPAVMRRSGTVNYGELTRTAIVTIRAGEMDDRSGPYGGTEAAAFSERSRKWWKVAADKQPKIDRLIAILSGSHGVILGDWDVDSRSSYGPHNNVFPLVNPSNDDPRGIKGMRLDGVSGQSGRIYSADLRH